MSNTLKQLLLVALSAATLAGCTSAEKKPEGAAAASATAPATATAASAEGSATNATAATTGSSATATQAQGAASAAGTRSGAAAAPAGTAAGVATLQAVGLFDFNKSVLRPDAKAALDSGIVSRKSQVKKVNAVTVSGHADRLGSDAYNQRLSEKRAEAVKAYLVGQGLPPNNITTKGLGEAQPLAGAPKCDDKLPRKQLIVCLQPHRRAEVELNGDAK